MGGVGGGVVAGSSDGVGEVGLEGAGVLSGECDGWD